MSDRSYRQFCGLARSLDVIGDRWSLLIVRELLTGPLRYNELLAGLPGIATNLLADRLRALQASGVVERRIAEPSGVAYALTAWGEQLREPVEALIRWSAPLMAGSDRHDTFNPRWLAVALGALLRDRTAEPPVEIGIDVAGAIVALRIDRDGPHVTVEPDQVPDTIFTATPETILGLAAGAIGPDDALVTGKRPGDRRALRAIFATT